MSQHLPPLRRVDLQIRPGCGQAYTVEVRYGDLDTLGHVNNVAMVRVLEEGRSRMVADHRLFDGFLGTALWRSWDRFVTSLLPRGVDREGYITACSTGWMG